MIKAYVVGISTHYEGEDIEIRFSIYDEEELISQERFLKEYKKPLIVSHTALMSLLKKLRKHKGQHIEILINDASLYDQLRGTSQIKKPDVLKMLGRVKKELIPFGDALRVVDVSQDHKKRTQWSERLDF